MARLKNKLMIVILTALGTICASLSPAGEVNLARVEPGSGRFHASFGLDPALITTVGYFRGFELGSGTALWDVDLGVVVAETDAKDLRIRLGLQTTLWQTGDWRIAARGRLIARSTSNSIYDGAGFGADLTSHLGYYRHGWFVAGMIGYDRTFVMHLEHSDWYRDNVYDGAVDGWYRGESGILHGGLAAGFAAGAVEVAGRVEMRRLDGGESLDPPFVGELSVSIPF